MSRAERGSKSTTGRRKRRTLRRALAASALVGLALTVLILAVLYFRLTAQPEWWTPELANDAHAVELGEEAEKGMTRVLSREREAGEAWSVEVTQEQANAWLATRLERWANSQHADWPASVRGVRIRFREDAVTIGVAIDTGGSARFASITLVPETSATGVTHLRAESAKVGVQSVPLTAVRSAIERFVPERAIPAQVMNAISEGVIALPESFALDEHRRVRVSAVEALDGRLRVVCASSDP